MASSVILDSKVHQSVRVRTDRGAEFGENMHLVPVIADELPRLLLEYPVCLIKDSETGQFGLHALLGFEPGENLFLDGNHWDAMYVPMHLRRQPFMVGIAGDEDAKPTPENTMITIDMGSARISETEGERLFDDGGEATQYLQSISELLSSLLPGISVTDVFVKQLADYDLIEPARLDVTFANGEQRNFDGLYTVSDEKLRELDDQKLRDLHDRGYLQASHLLLASIGQVQRLINRKNARLTAAG